MGKRTKRPKRKDKADQAVDQGGLVEEALEPGEVRGLFEGAATVSNEPVYVQERSVVPPVNVSDARQRYLYEAASPPPAAVAGKDRQSLKKRKRFGRRRRRKTSSSSSHSSSSSSDEDDVDWDDLIDSRYTPLIIDLADWVGYITGRKVPWEKFFDKIWSGVLLCDFCNSINKLTRDPNLPGINMSTHTDRGKTFVRYNVEVYILWCKQFGVPPLSVMDVSDLVDKKSVKMVLGTLLAVGREMRARSLPCPVVAILEQTYKMTYDTMIDAVVDDQPIEDADKIHDSIKVKRKRFQLIKSKAQSGSALREGAIDADSKNIQEDILCLMYLKGFRKGDSSADSVILGWQGAVRSGNYKSNTLPSNFKGKLENFESMDLRYGKTLPRNYGGIRSPDSDDQGDDSVRAIEELKNYKSPELNNTNDERDGGFGFGDIFGDDENEDKEAKGRESEGEYILTIPPEQFKLMRDSGMLDNMLDSYQMTEEGEYNVTLTGGQYEQFQTIVREDMMEPETPAPADDDKNKKSKKNDKKKKKRSKSHEPESELLGANGGSPAPLSTPKSKKKGLRKWKSQSNTKRETSESEGDGKRKRRFSFAKKSKKSASESEDGQGKKRSSLFGKKKKSKEPKEEEVKEEEPPPQNKEDPEFGVWPNIQNRIGAIDNASLSLTGDDPKRDEEDKHPHSRIPPHLNYNEPPRRDYKSLERPTPDIVAPDYKKYQGYNLQDEDDGNMTDVSEYSIVSFPIIGRRRRKKRKRHRGPPGTSFNSDVGCLECFVMIFCPWRWVSFRQ